MAKDTKMEKLRTIWMKIPYWMPKYRRFYEGLSGTELYYPVECYTFIDEIFREDQIIP